VRICGAADSIYIFQPCHPHATSVAAPELVRAGVAFPFSNHILKVFREGNSRTSQPVIIEDATNECI